ncbi:hypothetical protein NC653_023085 [Populus alba x Populus x berolinensis]|uniref:Uncharacterized protein n=1 Tax=Populus alba x Populus x berolinensis TaxID=444605 RepID=A0AAD6QAI6_9ROSI|nr:hypothetical protein NC653_023085 [Populus alba x Populus x berolinensis]
MKTTLRLLFQPADISFVFIGQTLVRAQAQFRSRLRIKVRVVSRPSTNFQTESVLSLPLCKKRSNSLKSIPAGTYMSFCSSIFYT